jgi:Ferritin-like domain
VDIDMPDTQASAQAPSSAGAARRRLLGAGVAGLAVSLLPRFASRASAGTEPASTTTAPPKPPTDGDVDLLAFAQTVELAAVDLYDMALDVIGDGDERSVFAAVRESHQAYAQSIGALIGTAAPGEPLADVVSALEDAFSTGSTAEIASAAYDLESTAVATHTELLGQLQGTDGAALVASIMIVEARHCTVFATIAGETDLDTLLLTDATALEPTEG